jgi:hypothetical protein
MFRALNADTAPNFAASGFAFVMDAYKAGFDTLVTQFRDQSLINIFRNVSKNPPNPGMGYNVTMLGDGQYQVALLNGLNPDDVWLDWRASWFVAFVLLGLELQGLNDPVGRLIVDLGHLNDKPDSGKLCPRALGGVHNGLDALFQVKHFRLVQHDPLIGQGGPQHGQIAAHGLRNAPLTPFIK